MHLTATRYHIPGEDPLAAARRPDFIWDRSEPFDIHIESEDVP